MYTRCHKKRIPDLNNVKERVFQWIRLVQYVTLTRRLLFIYSCNARWLQCVGDRYHTCLDLQRGYGKQVIGGSCWLPVIGVLIKKRLKKRAVFILIADIVGSK